MALPLITDFYIYRWRYWIGYGSVAVALLGLLIFAGLFLPGGLSSDEAATTITSANLFSSGMLDYNVIDLPYLLLQRGIFELFGISTFTIKLPSLILSFASAAGMILLLRRWFAPGIAVLTSLLAVTTGQFVFIAQNGTPAILPVFWSVFLLLVATYVANKVKPRAIWKSLFFVLAALSLYTPLSLYVLIALISAVALHPHLRFIIKRLSWKTVGPGVILGFVLIAPLIWSCVQDPSLILTLLGLPSSWPNLLNNLWILANQYFGFVSIGTGTLITPVFGMGSTLIIGYGLYRTFKSRQTVQSYVILAWLAYLLPVLIINPSHSSILFLPFLLLLSTGLQAILKSWYKLFPRNPYARFVGLLPLIVLVGGLAYFGLERYVYGYHYSPTVATNFSRDLRLLPDDTKNLVVSEGELEFYQAVAKYREDLNVYSDIPAEDVFVSSREARPNDTTYKISQIITSPMSSDADRFYIYQKPKN